MRRVALEVAERRPADREDPDRRHDKRDLRDVRDERGLAHEVCGHRHQRDVRADREEPEHGPERQPAGPRGRAARAAERPSIGSASCGGILRSRRPAAWRTRRPTRAGRRRSRLRPAGPRAGRDEVRVPASRSRCEMTITVRVRPGRRASSRSRPPSRDRMRGRLVETGTATSRTRRAGDRDPLPLAAAEAHAAFATVGVDALGQLVDELERLCASGRLAAGRPSRPASRSAGCRRSSVEQMWRLRYPADSRSPCRRLQRRRAASRRRGSTRVGLHEPHEQPCQGRLAGAVAPMITTRAPRGGCRASS